MASHAYLFYASEDNVFTLISLLGLWRCLFLTMMSNVVYQFLLVTTPLS